MAACIRVRVPASTSNLGAGFDCVGVAVDRWLTVTARVDSRGESGIRMYRHGTLATLPIRVERDAVVVGFHAACTAAKRELPDRLTFEATSDIPIARGLGSSAAATVAGAAAASALLELGLDAFGIAEVATAIEGHPDNVCPAVFGGATLALTHAGKIVVAPLEVHSSLALVFAVPDTVVETRRARAALPNVIPHATGVQAAARAAALVRGLATADAALLAAAFDDVLHVPHRRTLVPGFDAVTGAAVRAGAFGATLSGSGSTIVAVAPVDHAAAVEQAMVGTWREQGLPAESFTSAHRVRGYAVERED